MLQFPPPQLYSQSKAKVIHLQGPAAEGTLHLGGHCHQVILGHTPEAQPLPSQLSPGHSAQTCHFALPYSCCLYVHTAAVWHTAGPQMRVGRTNTKLGKRMLLLQRAGWRQGTSDNSQGSSLTIEGGHKAGTAGLPNKFFPFSSGSMEEKAQP